MSEKLEALTRVTLIPPMPELLADGSGPVKEVAFKQWLIPTEAYNHIRHQAKMETYRALIACARKSLFHRDLADFINYLWGFYKETGKEME
jgi:hypothetical protein